MADGRNVSFHLRVPDHVWAEVRRRSAERGSPAASVVRSLLADALAAPEPPPAAVHPDASPAELQLHLLIAVEQVIALIESILPEGEGAAGRVLTPAALAAQRRIAGEVEVEEPA